MTAFQDLLDFPEVALPAANFDSVELRHIAMAEHDVECPCSYNLDRTCVCQPVGYVNGQPVYNTLPFDGTFADEDDEDRGMDYTERMETLANA